MSTDFCLVCFSCYYFVMASIEEQLDKQKELYREIFIKSDEEIKKRFEELRSEGVKGDLLTKFPQNSSGQNWQKACLELLNGELSRDVYDKMLEILAYRKMFKCTNCATCCKLACSEFSYDELKEKAQNGDNFAQQFTSVFVPYENFEDARAVYPEYVDIVTAKTNGKIYFYHCPKLTAENRCSEYENRPQICRDFPDNPLDILPEKCGFCSWKEEINPIALMLHSMIAIIEFYKRKLVEVIE